MDMELFIPLQKFDPEQRMVYGYASTDGLDNAGERITKAAVEEALPDYMRWANIREMHQLSAVGTVEKADLDDKGLYIGARIVDDTAWTKIKEGVYKGFSLGGKKLQQVGSEIQKIRLREISLVDRPMNPECRIDLWKADGQAKSDAEARVQELKKMLAKAERDLEEDREVNADLHKRNNDLLDIIKAEVKTKEDVANLEGVIHKLEEAMSKVQQSNGEAISRLENENKALQDRLAKIEAQPAEPKAALKDLSDQLVIGKDEDGKTLSKTESDEKDTLSLIKAAHQQPKRVLPFGRV